MDEKFFSHIRNNDVDKVRALVAFEPTLIKATVKSMTPLMEAAYKGHVDLVAFFLGHVDPNHAGFEGYTPLMMAALGGHVEATLLLLEAGADRNTKNKLGKSAPMMCGFVNMKTTHRVMSCWIDKISFYPQYAATLPQDLRQPMRRFLSHPNCLPISIVKRLAALPLASLDLTVLVAHLGDEIKTESEFPIVLRYQLLISVMSLLNEQHYTPLKLFKRLLKDKELYMHLLKNSCLELNNRGESASIRDAVNKGHAQLIEAVRKFIGDTADDKLCSVCFEPSELRCARCPAIYCDRQCQKYAWPRHQKQCTASN